jgi:hypothetical protein
VDARDHPKCNVGTEQQPKRILRVPTNGWTVEIDHVFHQEETEKQVSVLKGKSWHLIIDLHIMQINI